MEGISRLSLFGKLHPVPYRAIDGAATLCKTRRNPYVELAHWMNQLLLQPDNDLQRIVRHFDLDAARLAEDVLTTLDGLPRGATAIVNLAPQIEEATERGWVVASLMFQADRVSSGHLVLGMLQTPGLRSALIDLSTQFTRIRAGALAESFVSIVAGSAEEMRPASSAAEIGSASVPDTGRARAKGTIVQQALDRFSIDLTEKARKGELDPVIGREKEIHRVIDVLMRRRQNNPILTGEAGVGKTAVVEGLALRIASGDVPPALRDVILRTLDIGLLQAGAGMKGEFEDRLRQVIDEVQASSRPIVLFIDEAHTLVGAGGAAGTGDAANLLKPALARGSLRTVAATTWAEYKKYFEKDPALTRRFQVVQVDEPDEATAVMMMRGLTSGLERHHRVQILDEALEAAVRLSRRYIPARQLPDKAVSLLDTAAARVAVSQHAVPAELSEARHQLAALRTELEIILRETAVGLDAAERAATVETRLASEADRLAEMERRWQAEQSAVDGILALRQRLRIAHGPVEGRDPTQDAGTEPARPGGLSEEERRDLLAELRRRQSDLALLQGEAPLVLPTVDAQAVASVVGDWTGIPVGRMVKDEIATVLRLCETLERRIVGQSHALAAIAGRVRATRAGVENPERPVGVFLLCGPSGVGKTETALALAETLYGGEQNLITINMSEYQEAHTVSSLKGAPPGYVGYGEGGVLTEAVRRRPYSVILLDEVEKAHRDVHELFFQVFDKGTMEDGEGRRIDFRNTLILLASNVGSDLIMAACRQPDRLPDPEALIGALRGALLQVFPAALLGRLITVPYYPLNDAMIGTIIRLQFDRIVERIGRTRAIALTYDDAAVGLVAARCTEPESGGRMIDAILTGSVLPAISTLILDKLFRGETVQRIHVAVENGDFTYRVDDGEAS